LRMMQSEHLSAFDLDREPAELVESYGKTDFGRRCLVARRLVEAGIPFVEVVSQFWDHHAGMYTDEAQGLLPKAAELDTALTALVADLRQRGLLESTLIVWMGEFGRTPKLRPLPRGGREHYSAAWSTMLLGGGISGGQVIGKTDASGAEVVDRPVSIVDFLSTICQLLGIDPDDEIMGPGGRPLPIVDNQTQTPKPILELL
jgi:hypothetical protein